MCTGEYTHPSMCMHTVVHTYTHAQAHTGTAPPPHPTARTGAMSRLSGPDLAGG